MTTWSSQGWILRDMTEHTQYSLAWPGERKEFLLGNTVMWKSKTNSHSFLVEFQLVVLKNSEPHRTFHLGLGHYWSHAELFPTGGWWTRQSANCHVGVLHVVEHPLFIIGNTICAVCDPLRFVEDPLRVVGDKLVWCLKKVINLLNDAMSK